MRPGTPSLPSWYPKRPGKQDLDHSKRRCRLGLYAATANRGSLLDDAFGTAGADLRLVGWTRSGGNDFRRCVHRRTERSTEGDGNRPDDGNSVWHERSLGFGRSGGAAATGFLARRRPVSQGVQRRDGPHRRRRDQATVDRRAPEGSQFFVLLQGFARKA